jgi:hypothetical protein
MKNVHVVPTPKKLKKNTCRSTIKGIINSTIFFVYKPFGIQYKHELHDLQMKHVQEFGWTTKRLSRVTQSGLKRLQSWLSINLTAIPAL